MTQQWANIGEDLGALPALVRGVEDHVPVNLVDFLWIFPARRIAIGESTVLVIAAFADDEERRRVITTHYTVSRNRRGEPQVRVRFDEHGTAPHAAVPRIVEGVLRRLGEDTAAEPTEVQVGGDVDTWDSLIRELGGTPRTREDESAPSDGSAHPQGSSALPGEPAATPEEPASTSVGPAAAPDNTVPDESVATSEEPAAATEKRHTPGQAGAD